MNESPELLLRTTLIRLTTAGAHPPCCWPGLAVAFVVRSRAG